MMNGLTYLILLAIAIAGYSAWRRSRAGSIATIVVLFGMILWMQHQKEEQRKAAILALAQEVSPAQYLTLAAIANKTPEGRAAVRRAIIDGHVIWSEYSPIEQEAAAKLAYGAREDAMRATGVDVKAAQARDQAVLAKDPSKGTTR